MRRMDPREATAIEAESFILEGEAIMINGPAFPTSTHHKLSSACAGHRRRGTRPNG